MAPSANRPTDKRESQRIVSALLVYVGFAYLFVGSNTVASEWAPFASAGCFVGALTALFVRERSVGSITPNGMALIVDGAVLAIVAVMFVLDSAVRYPALYTWMGLPVGWSLGQLAFVLKGRGREQRKTRSRTASRPKTDLWDKLINISLGVIALGAVWHAASMYLTIVLLVLVLAVIVVRGVH